MILASFNNRISTAFYLGILLVFWSTQSKQRPGAVHALSSAFVRSNTNPLSLSSPSSQQSSHSPANRPNRRTHNEARTIWIEGSLKYYATITRGSRHSPRHQRDDTESMAVVDPQYLKLAMENYFAREKIKMGKAHHAETIYRRLMEEMVPHQHDQQEEPCDFSSLAVPTLLLALLLQREERFDDARSVLEGFTYIFDSLGEKKQHKCCCSARVFQAYALFEMKQDNPQRAVQLMFRAIRLDKNLRPVLRWRQFRNAMDTMYHHHRLPDHHDPTPNPMAPTGAASSFSRLLHPQT